MKNLIHPSEFIKNKFVVEFAEKLEGKNEFFLEREGRNLYSKKN